MVAQAHGDRQVVARALIGLVHRRRLWSTSGPKGPRRRLRRRVPGNTGRRAGDARSARAVERAQARSTGGGGVFGEALA